MVELRELYIKRCFQDDLREFDDPYSTKLLFISKIQNPSKYLPP